MKLDDEALALALRCESEPFTAKLMLSATDANEAAVRLCLVHWQRRRGARGRGGGADRARRARRRVPRRELAARWVADGGGHLVEMAIEELQSAQALARRLTPDVAALLVEPVCSATGRVAVEGAAQAAALRRACARAGVPLIADETRCGLGRCGALCAEARGLAPAVTTLGDALGGGFAQLAAVVYDEAALGGGGGGKAPPFPSTATLCNDSLSSHVGLAAVRGSGGSRQVRAAAAFELELRTTLDGSRPTVERVGGCGLMVSVRFAPDRCAAFAARRGAARRRPTSRCIPTCSTSTPSASAPPQPTRALCSSSRPPSRAPPPSRACAPRCAPPRRKWVTNASCFQDFDRLCPDTHSSLRRDLVVRAAEAHAPSALAPFRLGARRRVRVGGEDGGVRNPRAAREPGHGLRCCDELGHGRETAVPPAPAQLSQVL